MFKNEHGEFPETYLPNGKLKKIFVIDHSDRKPKIDYPTPEPIKKVEESKEEVQPVERFYSKRKKMTARQFILETLNGDVYSTEELARKYIKGGYSNKPFTKVKNLMSTTISLLRKEGAPIIKIKAGRYGIRK